MAEATAPQMFLISEPLAQAITNYLARCPYADVFTLVDALRQLQRAQIATSPRIANGADTANSAISLASEGT